MDACTILHVHFVAHFYVMNITTNHCIEPYGTLLSHSHVSHNAGIGRYKTICTELWCMTIYRKNDGLLHNKKNIFGVKFGFLPPNLRT
jgi:hypothetical protein